MLNRTTRLRYRRIFRKRRRSVEDAAEQAEQSLEKHFFKRLPRLANVRRFVFGWVGLLVLLISSVGLQARGLGQYYQKIAPAEGGTMREGLVGTFSNANPLYAATLVDSSVSKLVFSGLMTHDANNQLTPDLADKWESDDKGQVYKVTLRKNIIWHDGVPFTSADVVFTYKTLQNPDAKSPLLASWQGVEVTAINDYVVQFKLPSPLASFPYSLTNGIVPKHILGSTPVSQLRSVPFNSVKPIGTGPFMWGSVEVGGTTRENRSEQVALKRYRRYHRGSAKIEEYLLKTYRDEPSLIKAFQRRELTAFLGVNKLPEDLSHDETVSAYNVPMASEVMIFMNTSKPLLQDAKVRQALTMGTNRAELIRQLGFPVVTTNEPLLRGQIGYDASVMQRNYSMNEANTLLDSAGWLRATATDIRKKDGKPLTISFVSQNLAEYTAISQNLQKQWKDLGVTVDVKFRSEEDMQGDILYRHNYDVLLYGISIGQDPDVFAYWHSSQADIRSVNRLNFSEYKSKVADAALEAGRTRIDPGIRALKYKPFLQAWRDDAPAITLYQPRFLYVTRTELVGFDTRQLNGAVDRLSDVQNWTVIQDKVLK